MVERQRGVLRMTVSLTATAAALAISLPIFALGERIRERGGRPLNRFRIRPTRKDIP